MINRFLKNNLSLKIISIVVAIILWLYAVSELNPETSKNITDIPVEIINMKSLEQQDLTLAEKPVTTISFRIKGLANDIRKVNINNLKAVLDLEDVDWTGTQQVELAIEGLLPREVHVEKNPQISLTINNVKTRPIPVVINVTGNGAEGYFVHEPSAEPRSISIYGAQSLVDKVVQGLVEVNLDKDEGTIEQPLPIKLVDAAGNVVESEYLHLRQDSAMVTIPIHPIKILDVRANVLGKPADGFVIDDIVVDPTQITVNGYASIIERMSYLLTESIDIQGAVEDVHITINLARENGIYLEPGQPSRVNVLVSISETVIETDLTIDEIELRNIPEGYLATPLPFSINLRIQGPYTLINPLTEESLAAFVDLATIDTEAEGFIAGEFALPVSVQIPNMTAVQSISSETITIDLQPTTEEPAVTDEPDPEPVT